MQIIKSDHNDAVRLEALKRIDDEDIPEDIVNDLNPLIRINALQRLGTNFTLNKHDFTFEDIDLNLIKNTTDENILYSIVNNAPFPPIRRYAFKKIKDENILAKLACSHKEFMNMALNKVTDEELLLNIGLYSTDISTKRKAIKKIDDEELLLKAVQNTPYNEISTYIIDRIRTESHLAIIAFNNSNPFNRKAAINKIQSRDILISLGENESEEIVCNAVIRKTHDKELLEYIGLSNPYKNVRRYVESITDDEELLYKFALKEYEIENKIKILSKMTNEEYIFDLLKKEDDEDIYKADIKLTNQDMLLYLAKNLGRARCYALNTIKDKSILIDYIYSSPFSQNKPKNKSLWENLIYTNQDLTICLSILSKHNFDMKLIETFLIENQVDSCSSSFELYQIRYKITEISSIYKIVLNCKSKSVRRILRQKLEYSLEEYKNKEKKIEKENMTTALNFFS